VFYILKACYRRVPPEILMVTNYVNRLFCGAILIERDVFDVKAGLDVSCCNDKTEDKGLLATVAKTMYQSQKLNGIKGAYTSCGCL
jgi:hypothetical protein